MPFNMVRSRSNPSEPDPVGFFFYGCLAGLGDGDGSIADGGGVEGGWMRSFPGFASTVYAPC
jgi:hypothetical protein